MTPKEAILKLIKADPSPNPHTDIAAKLTMSETYVRRIAKGTSIPGPRLWRDIQRELEVK